MTDNKMELVRGDTKNFYVVVKDQDGNIFDLNGYTMTFTARSSYSSDEIAITATATISSPSSGRGDFELTTDDTDILEGIYKYDVQIDGGGKRYTVVRNQELEVTPGVTQNP